MAEYTIEMLDNKTVIVLKRNPDFLTLLPIDAPIGTRANVTAEPDAQYAEYDVHRVLCPGWAKFQRIGTELYAINHPGERPWETLERLRIDEENLLP